MVEHADDRLRPARLRQRLQRREVVGAVHGGHDDALFAGRGELCVHHDPRGAPVAIGKGVDLGDQEHHEHRALERRFQAAAQAKTLGQRAGHEVRRNEHGGTGLVARLLEGSGPHVGTTLHDSCVTAFQQRFQCAGIGGGPAHLPTVGDDAPSPQDIVRVRGPFIGNGAPEHDVGGLVDGELGALDEVRETGSRTSQAYVTGRDGGPSGRLTESTFGPDERPNA